MNRRILIVTFFLFLGINEIKSQTIEIPYQDFEWNCNFKSSSGNFIIRNRSELKEFSTCNLFSFDFEKYTIIGVQGLNVGHEVPVVVFKILMDNSNKIITVEAKIYGGKSCSCRVGKPSFKKFIYVDKLPSDYQIEFKKEMIND